MKNTVIRAFVLSLTVVGFGAATVASHARTVNTAKTAQPSVVGVPMPVCLRTAPAAFAEWTSQLTAELWDLAASS